MDVDKGFYYENSTDEVFFEKIVDLMIESTTQNDTYDYYHDENTLNNKFNKTTLGLHNVLLYSLGALAIVLNLTVLVSSGLILKKGQQPKTTYLFLGNVALTDFIYSVNMIFCHLYPRQHRNHIVCAIQMGMLLSSTLASDYSVGLIAIDRYLYLIHGMMYQKWMYPSRARTLITITWIYCCIIAYLPLMGWYNDTHNGKKCWFLLLLPKYLILLTAVCAMIPMMVVIILYSLILFHAINNIFRLEKENDNEPTENGLRTFRGKSPNPTDQGEVDNRGWFKRIILKKPSTKVKGLNKWKAFKIVFFTSGCFILTWGPYFTTAIVYIFTEDPIISKRLEILILSPLKILGFANSLINPIIYAWWHKGFRHFVRRKWNAARRGTRENSQSPVTSESSSSSRGRKISNNLLINHVIVHF